MKKLLLFSILMLGIVGIMVQPTVMAIKYEPGNPPSYDHQKKDNEDAFTLWQFHHNRWEVCTISYAVYPESFRDEICGKAPVMNPKCSWYYPDNYTKCKQEKQQ